ncbi:MAG: hypothetical protein H0Z29_03435 [Candidatus Marinimicrobia bacterium]|nr:hypothetical protein [Candidatus Neomarinimicrobiota bacterium]
MKFKLRLEKEVKNIYLNRELQKEGKVGNIPQEEILAGGNGEKDTITENIYLKRIKEIEEKLAKASQIYYKAGYEEGIKIGRKEVKEEIETLKVELQQSILNLKEQFNQAIESLEDPLVRYSLKVAEKIIHTTVEDKSIEIARNKIKTLLKKLTDQVKITIKLSPQIAGSFGDIGENPDFPITPNQRIIIIEDDCLKPGECILETDNYIIESTIRRELENIESELFKEF